MKDRIKQVRLAVTDNKKKMTQAEFAEALYVTRAVIAFIELGRQEPSTLFIGTLCDKFGVNEKWLLTGEGEMFLPKDKSEEIADLVNDIIENEDSFKSRLILTLAKMDEEKLAVLQEIAHALENNNSPLL